MNEAEELVQWIKSLKGQGAVFPEGAVEVILGLQTEIERLRRHAQCALDDERGRDLIDGGITAWIESFPTDAEIRNGIVEECAHAAFEAYGSITSSQYVLEGPAGLAKRMINSIKALSLTPAKRSPIENVDDGAS